MSIADFLARTSVALVLFFSTDTPPTQIYTLSLHDALPISTSSAAAILSSSPLVHALIDGPHWTVPRRDRKSTRLNSSHSSISYAVFCLKKKDRPGAHWRDDH